VKILRRAALALLAVVYLAALAPEVWAPASYAAQFRETPNASPSATHLLGTDELGRDRFSRLLYGSRVSLLLAPAAALLATALAAIAGGAAGWLGGRCEQAFLTATDLSLALPWLFALITIRAAMPLDVEPIVSLTITFLLLGAIGSVGPARVVRAGVAKLRTSEFIVQARAAGVSRLRVLLVHLLPNLRPVLLAQFLVSIPVFIISEANLGLLGLGVAEPMPSWGGLLRELENISAVQTNPWMIAPALLLILVVISIQLVVKKEDFAA
jgi:peptide/nickel transport system permease protein